MCFIRDQKKAYECSSKKLVTAKNSEPAYNKVELDLQRVNLAVLGSVKLVTIRKVN